MVGFFSICVMKLQDPKLFRLALITSRTKTVLKGSRKKVLNGASVAHCNVKTS